MPDGINIEVVDPGSEDDPFKPASADISTPASASASDEDEEGDEEEDDEVEAEDGVSDEDDEDDDDEDDELTEDEVSALQELNDYLAEQARLRVEQDVVPKLQSTYDRQIAAQQRQIEALTRQQQAREQELREQVREAQANGLPEAERARLREQWDFEDKLSQLDARERELTEYHNELQKEVLVRDYSQFGLEIEDLDEFETPEEMAAFAMEVELEYHRLMAQRGYATEVEDDDEDEDERPAKSKSKSQTKARVPAGANAPSDAGGGRAVPEASKFNTGTGTGAMADNLKNLDWDTVKISS